MKELFVEFNLDINEYMVEDIVPKRGPHLSGDFPHLLARFVNLSDEEKDAHFNTLENYKGRDVLVVDSVVVNESDIIGAFLTNKQVKVYSYSKVTDPKESVKKLIENHLVGNIFLPPELLTAVEKYFPQYIYHGYAYRCVVTKTDFDPSLVTRGSSWALTKEGRGYFISGPSFFKTSRLFFIEGNISGINLVRLIREQFPELATAHNTRTYLNEEELLATEVHSILKVEEQNPLDFE